MLKPKGMSLIICTKDREEALQRCLQSLEKLHTPYTPLEIVLVDNRSTDGTSDVISQYKEDSKWNVVSVFCNQIGLGNARNTGVENSNGEMLIFTDDDCLVEPNYFIQLCNQLEQYPADFGGGQILLVNEDDDERIANMQFSDIKTLKPGVPYLRAGTIQGANMFVRREVFDAIGGFNPQMGSGTPFSCEDIEFMARANSHEYIGRLFPSLIVHHDHRRRRGSAAAKTIVKSYQYGKGAYLASLLLRGYPAPFKVWRSRMETQNKKDYLQSLENEMRGAADYIGLLTNRDTELPN